MKLTFRDLKKQSFNVEAEGSEKVADVKKKIADQQGPEFANVRLIYSGKILVDANTIGSYNIKETDHIICMQQKPKAAPVSSSAAPSTPAQSAPAQTPAAPAPPATSTTSNAPGTPTPAPSSAAAAQSPSERRFDDTSPLMLGPERQAAIANMESMGFERPQVERAMRAAFWNPDRAVEFLLNGIPENLAQEAPQRPPSGAQRPASGAGAGTASSPPAAAAATTTSAQPSTDPSEPVNLFEAAAAANRPGATRGLGTGGDGAGAAAVAGGAGAGAGAGAAVTAGTLDFLRDNPMFQQLRQLVQQQPQMLESVLQHVGASNPQLAQQIAQHPDQFIQLLSEGGDGEGGDMPQPPGANNVVSVTEEERDAIERLCRLGFERDLVIQAYFACDKNEELAANFLFDHPDDREGESEQ